MVFRSKLIINDKNIPVKFSKPKTLLLNPLTSKQQVVSNYLLPNIISSLIYILNFSADTCLAFQHYRDQNYFYASITLFLTYLPIIGSLFFILSDYDLWPDETGFGCENTKWLIIKLLEHLFYPIWAMYRFAEQLFWSIEAHNCTDELELDELLLKAERNSAFELYHFLQAYMQAAPQILFQLHIIFRQTTKFNKATVDMQAFCAIMSLIKMAGTTASYQRFKSQKVAGRQYAWKKEPVSPIQTIQGSYSKLDTIATENHTEENDEFQNQQNEEDRISDITEKNENSDIEADQDAIKSISSTSSGLSLTSSQFNMKTLSNSQNYNKPLQTNKISNIIIPKNVISYRGRPEDDAAGKLVSFLWWFCFILPRMLTLSAFAYFYPREIIWITISHYILTLAFLLYDAHTSDIPYYRALFILFTAYIYMFCLIEFKIKFKKIKFIYLGYFLIVYLENLVMTTIWYCSINFDQDWWYKYVMYVITGSSALSLTSMLLYLCVLKPKKVTVHQEYRSSKLL